jgi:hypothetical protein
MQGASQFWGVRGKERGRGDEIANATKLRNNPFPLNKL